MPATTSGPAVPGSEGGRGWSAAATLSFLRRTRRPEGRKKRMVRGACVCVYVCPCPCACTQLPCVSVGQAGGEQVRCSRRVVALLGPAVEPHPLLLLFSFPSSPSSLPPPPPPPPLVPPPVQPISGGQPCAPHRYGSRAAHSPSHNRPNNHGADERRRRGHAGLATPRAAQRGTSPLAPGTEGRRAAAGGPCCLEGW